nr:lens fiber membrane intrinsic protein-like [Chrysemys picta bellii]
MGNPRVPSTVLALLSLLLVAVALSSDHWLEARWDDDFVHSGLWKICVNLVCAVPSELPDYIEATKTFLTLGLLAGLLSAFSLLALLSSSDFDAMSPLVVSTMGSFSTGFCVLIALTVFTSEFAQVIKATWPHISFGWSWGLGWASILFFLLTDGVTLLAQESNSS